MTDEPRQSIHLAPLCAIVVFFAVVVVILLIPHEPDDSPKIGGGGQKRGQLFQPFPVVEFPESRYQNIDAEWVGSAVCGECHAAVHEHFAGTGMGRSMTRISADDLPPEGTVDHGITHRLYEIEHADGRLIHRELLTGGVPLSQHPVTYQIGSGTHARSYLVEVDGFLYQSPVTWFAGSRKWAISPGFESADQPGFGRAINQGCLRCHAGRSEPLDGTYHRMQIDELGISCERCHGPGSKHVARHTGGTAADPDRDSEGVDWTIVNPSDLSRELANDVCSQCHLQSNVSVPLPDRAVGEFRPGLPLAAFRTDFHPDVDDRQMTVVGHMSQMWQSRCYTESRTLSCLTCHNVHQTPAVDQRPAHYRSICLTCHQPDHCDVSADELSRRSPLNDCTTCHMPRSATEVPHTAFTHHRIGLHPDDLADVEPVAKPVVEDRPELDEPPKLVPLTPMDGLPEIVQQRALGIALWEAAISSPHAEAYRQESYRLLRSTWEQGYADPATASRMALLGIPFHDADVSAAIRFVLDRPPDDMQGESRINALLAEVQFGLRRQTFIPIIRSMEQVTQLRRDATDWALLGELYLHKAEVLAAIRNPTDEADSQATTAWETALEINPMLMDVRRRLISLYVQNGNHERAAYHRARLIPSR